MSIPASSPQSSAAYRGALLALQQQQRARLQLLIQQTEAQIAADWTRGPGIVAQYYAPVIDAYAKALNDLRLAEDDPAAKLSMSWLTSQNAQLASIEQSVRASMLNYGQQAARTVEDAQLAVLAKGQQDAEALTQEALSPAWEKGVNPAMLWNRPNPQAIAAWAGRAGNGHPLGDLFANFAPEATHEARQVLLMGLATGANPKTLVTGLQQAMGISRNRALTISRTELLGSYRTAAHESYRANADVLQGWLWSAGGANPCACCAGMDGTLHDLSEELNDHPCFPAGMLVSGPRALGSTTRWYEGDLVDIVTRDGRLLSVTPNHPILTSQGWIMAGLLEEGDDVVCHRVTNGGHAASVGGPDDYQVPTPIEQVASAFGRASDVAAVAVPLTAEHLHGNRWVGIQCQIDIVWANRVLRNAGDRRNARRQPLTEQHLHRRDPKLALLARLSAANLLRQWLSFATLGRLSGQHNATILLRGTFSGIDAGNGRRISTSNTSSRETVGDGGARDTKRSSERLLRLPGDVAPDDLRVRQTLLGPLRHSITHADEAIAHLVATEETPRLERFAQALLTDMEPRSHTLSALPGDIGLDRILEVRIRRFAGHVYNLQTSTGWYITEGIIAHNCGKCAPLPVTKGWDEILGPGIDTSDMVDTSIGAEGNYTSISEKFDSYSPEKQRAIIGTQTGYDAYKRGEVTLKDFIGVRPAQDGWPSQYYQKSLKELQIPTRQASRLVELRPDLMAKYNAGKLRASDLGKFTPYEQLPAWAKQSKAAEITYQILRNGLPYNMTSHEQGLLITNLEQMLKGELPTNVRAAAERQLLALGQSVERQTVGAAAKTLLTRESDQALAAAATSDLENASLQAALTRTEAQIAQEDVEHAVLFTPEGQELFHVVGGSREITFTADELAQLPGNILTHNHPDISSEPKFSAFSRRDLQTLMQHNPAEMRVVSPDGTLFTLRPPINGWGDLTYDDLVKQLIADSREAVDQMWAAYKAGEITRRDMLDTAWTRGWQKLARDTGIRFEQRA